MNSKMMYALTVLFVSAMVMAVVNVVRLDIC